MINDLLHKEVEDLKADLIKAYDSKGMRASGNWANTLEVKTADYKSTIWGDDYSQQLEEGRSKGKFPPIDKIKQWIEDKNLIYDIPINSLAFLIARKISREGWKRSRFGGVDLISEVVTEQRVQQIIDKIGNELILDFSNIIQKELV